MPAESAPEAESSAANDVVSRIEDDSDDDDDLTKQLMKVRRTRLAEEEDDADDVSVAPTPAAQPGDVTTAIESDDDALSMAGVPPPPLAPVAPVIKGFEPTPLQKAFIPASTPVACAHRFMVRAR